MFDQLKEFCTLHLYCKYLVVIFLMIYRLMLQIYLWEVHLYSLQIRERHGNQLEYMSHHLNGAKYNYLETDLEFIAIVMALKC